MPASEIATAASPAALNACSSISRDSPRLAGALGVGGAAGLADRVAGGAAGRRDRRGGRRGRSRRRAGVAPVAPLPPGRPRAGLRRATAVRARGPRRRSPGRRVVLPHAPILPARTTAARADAPGATTRAAVMGTIARVMTAARTAKPDAVGARAVDAARAALLAAGRRRRRRRAPRPRRRGRARRHPPLRLHPRRVPRLALGGHRRPRPAAEVRHRRRGRAAPRRRGDRRARRGCPTASGSSPATSAPGDLLPDRGRRPAAGARLLLGDDPLDDPTTRRSCATSSTSSASAGPGCSPSRAATWPPSAGTTATTARTSPLAQSAPGPLRRRAASWSGSPARSSQMFGVCANAHANDDGRVVSLDHGCGAHSEVQLAKKQPAAAAARPGPRHAVAGTSSRASEARCRRGQPAPRARLRGAVAPTPAVVQPNAEPEAGQAGPQPPVRPASSSRP